MDKTKTKLPRGFPKPFKLIQDNDQKTKDK